MDLGYWGFAYWPFQRRIPTDGITTGTSHEEALARLLFVVDEQRRCASVIGLPGSGKSCLFQAAAKYARRQGRICLEIDASGMDGAEMLVQLAEQLHLDCQNHCVSFLWPRIQQQLANFRLVQQSVVLLVDNLDAADANCGQVLRRLISLSDAANASLTMLLSSRSQVANQAIREQIEMTIELAGWSQSETADYVQAALHRAGASRVIFTNEALKLIHDFAGGIPAEVIRICDLTLLAAMADDRRQVDATVVEGALAEFCPRPVSNAGPRSVTRQIKAGSTI